jgi:hypothetical protein
MALHSRLTIIMPDEPIPTFATPSPEPSSPLDMRPLVQVRRIALIEREVREFLSRAALDALFADAEVMSEGDATLVQGRSVFVGSTMLTFDLAHLADILREPIDAGTARRLAELLAKDQSLESRAHGIVRREVERLMHAKPKAVRGETRIRTQGTRIFLDIDVEATLP